MRRGLVLGCGGPVGRAWMVAVLAELERAWDWDARTAEVIIGTSAGAELACLLGGGVAAQEILDALRGEPAAPNWLTEHVRVDAGRLPGSPSLRIGSPALGWKALRGAAPALAGVVAGLPVGRGDASWLRELAGRMASKSGWVEHPATWLVAADFETGERTAFGAPGAPQATLAEAVCASWALPLWLPPVEIAGRRYIDGGVLSPASADLAAGLELEELVVLAPMASSDPGRPVGLLARAERLVRRRMTRLLDAELATVEAAGTRVHRFEPGGRDLAVMGGNFMDARREAATIVSATASIRETVPVAVC